MVGPDFKVNIGKDELGKDVIIDVSKLSNLYTAGNVGTGKTNLLHKIITTISTNVPADYLKFILVDPKKVNFGIYNYMPHLLTKVISDSKKTCLSLRWLAKEVNRRLDTFHSKGVRDIDAYYQKFILNKKSDESVPYIFMIMDDFSNIINEYPKEIGEAVIKVIENAHITGITIIFSSSQVINKNITKILKTGNVRSQVVFKVNNSSESRVILNTNGAERLDPQGEILFQSKSMKFPICIKLSQIQEKEIEKSVKAIRTRNSDKDYWFVEDAVEEEDELYEEAKRITIESGKASTSYIQRKLGTGYSRAATLIDMLEARGVIGPENGSKPRRVIGKTE